MPFFPIAPSTDDRASKGSVPLVLRNVLLEPQPQGAGKQAAYYVRPSMGLTSRVTPSASKLMRGVFSRAGVQGGLLFAVMGDSLYSISDTFTATLIGTIGGFGRVAFEAIGANLFILASGSLYKWDGTTLSLVMDADFPANAVNLVSLGDRLLTNEEGSDTFDWSSAGDGASWPATGFAASARLPDPIIAQIEIAGYLWHFGAISTQVWAPQGGVDSEAFDLLSSIVINRGILGREAIAKLDSSAMWVGEDRVVYELNGFTPARVINRDLEIALAELGEPETTQVRCFSYANGSHLTWVVKLPTGRAWAFDTMTRSWSERATFGNSTYQVNHYARFQGRHVIGSDTDDSIFVWDEEGFSDPLGSGSVQERVMMLHVPVDGRTPVANITLDIKTYGQPLSGQGSDPEALITFYRDGGSLDSLRQIGVERRVKLGKAGKYNVRPTCWRLGLANTINGFIIKIRITDPVGFALHGVYVNEMPL